MAFEAGSPPVPQGQPPSPMMAPPPKPEWTPEALEALMEDFDLSSMDIAPTADPKSVTDMQRMMRAQYLSQFIGQPGINNQEIQKRMMEAANIEDVDKLFVQGPDPMAVLQGKLLAAEVKTEEATGVKVMAEAENIRQDGNDKAFNRGITAGTMAGGMGELEDAPANAALGEVPGAPGGNGSIGMDEPLVVPEAGGGTP